MATPRKILIASSNPWSFSVAVEREIALLEGSAAQVDVLNLFRLTTAVSPHLRRRDRLLAAVDRTIERFVVPAANGRDITADVRISERAIPPPDLAASDLRGYRFGGASVGLAVLSSVTSLTTIQEPESLDEYGDAFLPAWRSAHRAQQVGEQVAQLGYDAVYTFNGRHCYSRPFIDLVEQACPVVRYEQGATGTSYVVSATAIHHPVSIARLINEHVFDPPAGEGFFLDRINRKPGDAVNYFIGEQVAGFLPQALKDGGVVSFFTSSSDEMFAITDDFGFGSFPTQFSAAMAMAAACAERGLQLVVRFHPHMRFKHPSWRREWDFDALRAAGALMIDAEDPCDSYALARSSRCVFTCGSTIGFECSYLGIPNADLGLWVGGLLGAMPAITDEAALIAFIDEPRLLPSAKLQALRYGSYARRAGAQLPELEPGSHPYLSRVAGQVVSPTRFAFQRARQLLPGKRLGRTPSGMVAGKVLIDPDLDLRLDKAKLRHSRT